MSRTRPSANAPSNSGLLWFAADAGLAARGLVPSASFHLDQLFLGAGQLQERGHRADTHQGNDANRRLVAVDGLFFTAVMDLVRRAWVLGVFLLACGDPKPPADPGDSGGSASAATSGAAGTGVTGGAAGAGGSTAGGAGTGGAAGAAIQCNEIPADATDVMMTTDPNPAPPPEGGTILDGAYYLTGQTWFGQSGPFSAALPGVRVEIAGTSWQEVEGSADNVIRPPRRRTNQLTATGTTVTLTRTCPSAAASESMEYTAEDNVLTLYVLDAGQIFGTTFERH
jgi:hypothetical protein